MKKLLKLREWLTVEEAANYLSAAAEEDVTEADILRLSLDGHLTLSVNFVNHARGRPLRIESLVDQPKVSAAARDFIAYFATVPSVAADPKTAKTLEGLLAEPPVIDETEEYAVGLTQFLRTYRGELLPDGKGILILEGDGQKPERLEGIWDLLMLGAERLDIEHAYQNLTGGPSVDLVCLGGPLVSNPDRTKMYQLLDSYVRENKPIKAKSPPKVKPQVSKETREALDRVNAILGPGAVTVNEEPQKWEWDSERVYYPAGALPEDGTFVVRTAALRELESKLLAIDEPPEKPLHPNERRSVEQVIAALAATARLDISKPYAAEKDLRIAAAREGIELPNSPETIVRLFKAASAFDSKK